LARREGGRRRGGVGARGGASGGGTLREKHGRKRSRGRGGEATALLSFFPGRMGWERRIGSHYIFVGPGLKEKPDSSDKRREEEMRRSRESKQKQ